MPEAKTSIDVAELKRRELYNQRRPTRPPPAAAAAPAQPLTYSQRQPASSLYSSNQEPPGYATATRDNARPSVRARSTGPSSHSYKSDDHSLAKKDSFSTLDTKSIDSYDSEYSMNKPPLSYRPYDHHRQYSDEKKPFETDIDSMYSEDQPDTAPFYHYGHSQPQSRVRGAAYHPSPLARNPPGGYDSDTSSQRMYHLQNQYNSQNDITADSSAPSYYTSMHAQPPAETDIDAMSEMTDDWHRQGPPVETDF